MNLRRERKFMNTKNVGFKIGDYVKVRKGVLDPDNEEYCIEDWQGEIIEESTSGKEESIFLIKWDSVTLRNMPEAFIIESIEEDLEFGEMYLCSNDIIHAECRNKDNDQETVLRELNNKYDYIQPKSEGRSNEEIYEQEHRVAEILKVFNVKNRNEVEEKWEEYLRNNLEFPFKATIIDIDEDTEELDEGDIVNIKKIEGYFDLYGIIVEARKVRRKYHIPLCELEVNDKTSENYIKVDDYNFWFANY